LNFTSNLVRLRLRSIALAFLLLCVVLPIQFGMVRAEAFPDPTGDIFDNQGRQVTSEAYLDIVDVELTGFDGSYRALIRVKDALPSSVTDPTIFLEWDLMVDVDQNPGTHPWGPWGLLDNGIGVDLLVRLMLGPSGQGYRAEVFNVATRNSVGIDFKVDGATVQLNFDDKSLGVVPPKAFDFVFTARKYGNYGRAGSELALDKAPNEGHFTFSDGRLSIITVKHGLPTEKLQTDHAAVFYNQGNEKYARYIGDGFEFAYRTLQQDFPKVPAQNFKIYVYLTQDDLVQGIVTFSGFSQETAQFFKQVGGAPRPIDYVMHVGPYWDWVVVAHELTHTFIEEYSGKAYLQIKWLDEGLANYESWKCVSSNTEHSQEAENYRESAWKAFNDLKNTNGLFPLSQLTTEAQWSELMTANQPIYPEAFVVVTYLASTYGSSKIIPILEKIQNGTSESDAVKMILGKTESEILEAAKNAPESEIFGAKAVVTSTVVTSATSENIQTQTTLQTNTLAVTQSSEIPVGFVLILGIVALAVVVGAVLLKRRRQRRSNKKPSTD